MNDRDHDPSRLASALVGRLGIDFYDRENGLDDRRRYHALLREALAGLPEDAGMQELTERVASLVRHRPHQLAEELVFALGVAAEIDARSVVDLCRAMGALGTESP